MATQPFLGALTANKIILAGPGGPNTNTAGALFQTTTMAASTAGNVVPVGMWIVPATVNVVVQANTGASFGNVGASNAGGFIWSDGINVQLLGFGTNTASITIVGISPGDPIGVTFNT